MRWNNAPASGSLAFSAPVTTANNDSWLEIDITEYVKGLDLAQQPNIAFRVSAATVMQNQPEFRFYSRASGYKPQIVFVNDGVTVTDIESPSVRTVAGVAPVLPATVTVTYSDSSTEDKAVQWEAVDPASYADEGSFAVLGAISGISRPVMATAIMVST